MRYTPYTWRYLLPLMLLPAAALIALALRQPQGQDEDTPAAVCQPAQVSVDRAELLLQLVRAEEIQRQAQHQIDALLE